MSTGAITPPRFSRRQRLILFLLLGAGFMLSVDFSILNVALPDVGAGVGLETHGFAWIASAYALPAAGFTLVFVDLLSWRAAFFINVPFALAILLVAPLVIRESRVPERVRLDLPGAVAVTGGLLAVIYAVVEENLPAAVAGVLLLAAFWVIELRSAAPIAPVRILRRPTVKWGNYAGLVVFTMEPAMIFLMTLYLQNVLRFSPLETGLIFGVPGLASVAAGVIAGRLIGRHGSRTVLAAGLTVQGLATLPLVFLGTGRLALAILIPALLIGFFGHVTCIVAYAVTGTSGLPDDEQGLATGLTSMTQQVAIAIGIPILSAVAATQAVELTGIRLALSVNVAVTLASAILIWWGLRPREEHHRTEIPSTPTAGIMRT